MVTKLIERCKDFVFALKTLFGFWGYLNERQRQRQKRIDFHLQVLAAATGKQAKMYYALSLANSHLKHFAPNDPAFDAIFEADELRQLQLVLPMYQAAKDSNDPAKMLAVLDSPLIIEIGSGQGIGSAN